MYTLSQIPIPWEVLTSTGMAGVAFVLLWAMIQDRVDRAKDIRCISVTMITFQQMLLVQTFVRRADKAAGTEHEECQRLMQAIEEIHRILETQKDELMRINAK